MVGIDVGLERFATLSNGEKIGNPMFFRADETELGRAQRNLSKAPRETSERKKALKVVQRVHERIANKRYEFAHQTSRMLVSRFGTICFKNLNIKGMLQNHNLAKRISDVARKMLANTFYKAESACDILVEKLLSDQVHNCPQCGLSMDRDQNAAINILRLGTQSLRKSDRI